MRVGVLSEQAELIYLQEKIKYEKRKQKWAIVGFVLGVIFVSLAGAGLGSSFSSAFPLIFAVGGVSEIAISICLWRLSYADCRKLMKVVDEKKVVISSQKGN